MLFLSLLLACAKGLDSKFFFVLFKYIILFCSIIPIALRVNLDVSKTFFSYVINRDDSIPETIARNSTIPISLRALLPEGGINQCILPKVMV